MLTAFAVLWLEAVNQCLRKLIAIEFKDLGIGIRNDLINALSRSNLERHVGDVHVLDENPDYHIKLLGLLLIRFYLRSDLLNNFAYALRYSHMVIRLILLQNLLKVEDNLLDESNEGFFIDFSSYTIESGHLSSLILISCWCWIAFLSQSAEERVHSIWVGYMFCHQIAHFFMGFRYEIWFLEFI